jgi:hypothetical protein
MFFKLSSFVLFSINVFSVDFSLRDSNKNALGSIAKAVEEIPIPEPEISNNITENIPAEEKRGSRGESKSDVEKVNDTAVRGEREAVVRGGRGKKTEEPKQPDPVPVTAQETQVIQPKIEIATPVETNVIKNFVETENKAAEVSSNKIEELKKIISNIVPENLVNINNKEPFIEKNIKQPISNLFSDVIKKISPETMNKINKINAEAYFLNTLDSIAENLPNSDKLDINSLFDKNIEKIIAKNTGNNDTEKINKKDDNKNKTSLGKVRMSFIKDIMSVIDSIPNPEEKDKSVFRSLFDEDLIDDQIAKNIDTSDYGKQNSNPDPDDLSDATEEDDGIDDSVIEDDIPKAEENSIKKVEEPKNEIEKQNVKIFNISEEAEAVAYDRRELTGGVDYEITPEIKDKLKNVLCSRVNKDICNPNMECSYNNLIGFNCVSSLKEKGE